MYKHQPQWEDIFWYVGLILLFSVWYLHTYDTNAGCFNVQKKGFKKTELQVVREQHLRQGRPRNASRC